MVLFQDSRFETVSWLIVRPLSINDSWSNIFLSFLKYMFDCRWRPEFLVRSWCMPHGFVGSVGQLAAAAKALDAVGEFLAPRLNAAAGV